MFTPSEPYIGLPQVVFDYSRSSIHSRRPERTKWQNELEDLHDSRLLPDIRRWCKNIRFLVSHKLLCLPLTGSQLCCHFTDTSSTANSVERQPDPSVWSLYSEISGIPVQCTYRCSPNQQWKSASRSSRIIDPHEYHCCTHSTGCEFSLLSVRHILSRWTERYDIRDTRVDRQCLAVEHLGRKEYFADADTSSVLHIWISIRCCDLCSFSGRTASPHLAIPHHFGYSGPCILVPDSNRSTGKDREAER